MVGDTDRCRSDTTVVVAGRPLYIPRPLDEVGPRWMDDEGHRRVP